jgi:hypothetical protein
MQPQSLAHHVEFELDERRLATLASARGLL